MIREFSGHQPSTWTHAGITEFYWEMRKPSDELAASVRVVVEQTPSWRIRRIRLRRRVTPSMGLRC